MITVKQILDKSNSLEQLDVILSGLLSLHAMIDEDTQEGVFLYMLERTMLHAYQYQERVQKEYSVLFEED